MKKSIIVIVLLALYLSGFGQIVGVNFTTAKKVVTDSDIEYEKLLKLNDDYVIPFEQTPVGLKHCLDRLMTLMEDNGFNDTNYEARDVLLADYIESMFDYSSVCTSVRVGSSEVRIAWIRGGYRMTFVLSQKMFGFIFLKV